MAEKNEVLRIRLQVDETGNVAATILNARQAIQGAGRDFSEAGAHAIELNQGLELLEKGFELVKRAAEPLVEAFRHSIEEANAQELAIRQLNGALSSSGQYTEQYSEYLQKLSETLAQTSTASDSAILGVERLLISFGATPTNIARATRATLDMAAALGLDLPEAAQKMGKALEGNFTQFQRMGIHVDTVGSKSERLTQLFGKLEQAFGGQALAKVETFSGSLTQLEKTLDETSRVFGLAFESAPFVRDVLAEVRKELTSLKEGAEGGKASLRDFLNDGLRAAALGLLDFAAALVSGEVALSDFGTAVFRVGKIAAEITSGPSGLAAAAEDMRHLFDKIDQSGADAALSKLADLRAHVEQLGQGGADAGKKTAAGFEGARETLDATKKAADAAAGSLRAAAVAAPGAAPALPLVTTTAGGQTVVRTAGPAERPGSPFAPQAPIVTPPLAPLGSTPQPGLAQLTTGASGQPIIVNQPPQFAPLPAFKSLPLGSAETTAPTGTFSTGSAAGGGGAGAGGGAETLAALRALEKEYPQAAAAIDKYDQALRASQTSVALFGRGVKGLTDESTLNKQEFGALSGVMKELVDNGVNPAAAGVQTVADRFTELRDKTTGATGVLSDLRAKFQLINTESEAFGSSFDANAAKIQATQAAINTLISAGVNPFGAAVQDLIAHLADLKNNQEAVTQAARDNAAALQAEAKAAQEAAQAQDRAIANVAHGGGQIFGPAASLPELEGEVRQAQFQAAAAIKSGSADQLLTLKSSIDDFLRNFRTTNPPEISGPLGTLSQTIGYALATIGGKQGIGVPAGLTDPNVAIRDAFTQLQKTTAETNAKLDAQTRQLEQQTQLAQDGNRIASGVLAATEATPGLTGSAFSSSLRAATGIRSIVTGIR